MDRENLCRVALPPLLLLPFLCFFFLCGSRLPRKLSTSQSDVDVPNDWIVHRRYHYRYHSELVKTSALRGYIFWPHRVYSLGALANPSRAGQSHGLQIQRRMAHVKRCSRMQILENGLRSAFALAKLRQILPDQYLRFQPRRHSADTVNEFYHVLIMIYRAAA